MFARWLVAGLTLACAGASFGPARSVTCAPTRVVPVATSAQLTNAINNAQPGDSIVPAPGTYNGRWTITKSGSGDTGCNDSGRIRLIGPRTVILNGGSISSGNGIFLKGANYWTIQGFTITNSLGGIAGDHANSNELRELDIRGVGQVGVHLRVFSTHNIIQDNLIHGTGKYIAQYGEGVYIGTTESQWCAKTGCKPDKSDSNQVIGNTITDTKADGVQFMAGTTGTLVRRNTIDGSSMVVGNVDKTPPHWVLAMGNDGLVDSNTATKALTYGMKVRRSASASSWATNDVFRANHMTSGRTQPTIYLETPPAQGMIVSCDNVRTDSGPLSNLTCTP